MSNRIHHNFNSDLLEEERSKKESRKLQIKINNHEQVTLNKLKRFFEKRSDGTVLKACMNYCAKVLLTEESLFIRDTISSNIKNNKRNNISDFD